VVSSLGWNRDRPFPEESVLPDARPASKQHDDGADVELWKRALVTAIGSLGLLFFSGTVLSEDKRQGSEWDQIPLVQRSLGSLTQPTEETVEAKQTTLGVRENHILVLDFFAPWCAPCLEASRALNTLEASYRKTGKQPVKAIVEVLPINIDVSSLERSNAFATRVGLDAYFGDSEGRLFEALGGTSLPYIVVLIPSEDGKDDLDERIILKQSGFFGLDPLRAVIDKYRNLPSDLPEPSPEVRAGTKTRSAEDAFEFSSELLSSTDVSIFDLAVRWRRRTSKTDLDFSLTRSLNRIEYQPPFPPYAYSDETPLVRSEITSGMRVIAKRTTSETFAPYLEIGGYEGFTDHRSLWMDERYRQTEGGSPEYRTASPWGFDAGLGFRREYVPLSAFLEAGLTYQFDRVSPGYTRSLTPGLQRGEDKLDTWAFRLSTENALSVRLRTLHECSLIDTSGRELRFSYAGSLARSLSERWVLRADWGLSKEKPRFNSRSLGLYLEREITGSTFAGGGLRWYGDSGEIEDKKIISSAAPALHTVHPDVGIKWIGSQLAARINAGAYFSRYAETGTGTVEFFHLYQDRDWLFFDFALSYSF
tara:strand:+ start:986 stop:2758 length:1773 start_codon:yes stop_codon:yes gene_type:complete